ncbi:hypothetical protein [Aeromonas dhakensis]|uniref:hypothetical protein n=1 Tax=Aeromonas dhakensis TaxID=196024 RepID=UPI0038CFC6E6
MITNSLTNYLDLTYSEAVISESNKPALRLYMQNDNAIRIMNMADIKLTRFRDLTDFDHLRTRYSDHNDTAMVVANRRDVMRRRLNSIGVKQGEITRAGYSPFNGGEVYVFVVTDKKLASKDRHLSRTPAEQQAVDTVKQCAAVVKELQAILEAGQYDHAREKQEAAQAAMNKASMVMKSEDYKSAVMKRKLADNGADYVYFVVNEQRQGQRTLSTVYESQLPVTGNEFIAVKVTMGTKHK